MEVTIIAIDDEPIRDWRDELALAPGELGEIVVKGDVVTAEYKFQEQPTALAKIRDGASWRHRMGDIGCFDEDGRLWFCGRKAHRLETAQGLLMPVPIENLFNTHPHVHRSALVGVGVRGAERPVLVVELEAGQRPKTPKALAEVSEKLREHTADQVDARVVTEILFHEGFPVDVRHNAKIHREELKLWAEEQLA